MARHRPKERSAPSLFDSLTATERGEVLGALLAAHPTLVADAERIAGDLLSSVSVEQVASEVESALAGISLDALGARAGRVRGRGFVHETDAAWELVEEALEPFRSDLERRARLELLDAATDVAVGIVAGLHRVREPQTGTVLAYAGEDAPSELAGEVLGLASRVGLEIPADGADAHWPGRTGVR